VLWVAFFCDLIFHHLIFSRGRRRSIGWSKTATKRLTADQEHLISNTYIEREIHLEVFLIFLLHGITSTHLEGKRIRVRNKLLFVRRLTQMRVGRVHIIEEVALGDLEVEPFWELMGIIYIKGE